MPVKRLRPLEGYRLIDQLIEAGVVPLGSTKVIIEIDARRLVEIHYSAIAEERLLDVLPMGFKGASVDNASSMEKASDG